MRFKFLTILVATLLVCGVGYGQKVSFTANAPKAVERNEAFKVEFSVNAEYTDLNAPSFAGFEIIAGPSVAVGKSMSVVNGNVTRSVNYTITYVLMPANAGKFTIGQCEIKVDGKPHYTRSFTVDVVDEGGQATGAKQQTEPAQNGKISNEDLFVLTTVDKTTVYKGEPVRATFKIYSRNIPNQIEEVKNPAFNGFWAQELTITDFNWHRENYDGKVYDARLIREVLLYPQQSGTLTVEQFDANVIAQLVVKQANVSDIERLMGGGQQVVEIRKRLAAAPVKITVLDFPAGAPASFNGAVGNGLSMECTVPQGVIAANSGADITVKISGTGNLPLIKMAKLPLPDSFEQYNTKTTESLSTTASGINGYRQFEFPFIARAEGDYNVEPIDFTYFSPAQKRYITQTSGPIRINVIKDGSGIAPGNTGGTIISGFSKEDVIVLGQDIRFIKLGSPKLRDKGNMLIGSWLYYALLVVVAAGSTVGYSRLRKILANRQNVAFVKSKRANKVALGRLRTAESLMKQQDKKGFYEETLKALWGYMSDSLNIPVAILTKENIREELAKRGVPQQTTDKYINVISSCEYAQYSPEGSGHLEDTYNSCVNIISAVERIIKKG